MEWNKNIENATWRHVSSKCNPADLGTRGCNSVELSKCSLWWNGPMWLLSPGNNWPESNMVSKDPPEKRNIEVHCAPIIEKDDYKEMIQKFSSYNRTLWIIGYMYRMKNKRRKNEYSDGEVENFYLKMS